MGGEPEGLRTSWYANGQKKKELNWIGGYPKGVEISWDESGNKMSEVIYKGGAVIN